MFTGNQKSGRNISNQKARYLKLEALPRYLKLLSRELVAHFPGSTGICEQRWEKYVMYTCGRPGMLAGSKASTLKLVTLTVGVRGAITNQTGGNCLQIVDDGKGNGRYS